MHGKQRSGALQCLQVIGVWLEGSGDEPSVTEAVEPDTEFVQKVCRGEGYGAVGCCC